VTSPVTWTVAREQQEPGAAVQGGRSQTPRVATAQAVPSLPLGQSHSRRVEWAEQSSGNKLQ